MEVILELLLLLIFRYPGAGLRWLFLRLWRPNKKYKEFLEDATELNTMVFIVTLIVVFCICKVYYLEKKTANR